jgi:hypothetical protein
MHTVRKTALLGLAGIIFSAKSAEAKSLSDVFTPNAPICVKFDSGGHPIAALVDGKNDNLSLNEQMLEILKSGTWWGKGYERTNGQWIALSVAPNGYPVPEVLPSCPER